MVILGIETSCDETAAAILEGPDEQSRTHLLSNIVATSQELMTKYGGVIPEQAAREQIKAIIPVITEALEKASLSPEEIDAIAVTQGPGLIGSLLVGVETAKTLSYIWNKPLVPVNHLLAHFYANWVSSVIPAQAGIQANKDLDPGSESGMTTPPTFPAIGLLVSGGHSDLVLFKNHNEFEYLGGTRDDAAGECFDKTARLLGLPYPGGPNLSKAALEGDPKAYKLPRPMLDSGDYDFSFSGLKTAVLNIVKNSVIPSEVEESSTTQADLSEIPPRALLGRDDNFVPNMAASVQEAIVDSLVTKTIRAAQSYNIDTIIVSGGVAANKRLKDELVTRTQELGIALHIPPPQLCTDNAVMVASYALINYSPEEPFKVEANPNLSLSS